MDISIWNYKDYKKYLIAISRSPQSGRGIISRLSQAGECQPSYLSQVLNSKPQLTPDQAYGIAAYLNLSDAETDYFLTLLDYARAGSGALRKRLSQKLESLHSKASDIGDRLERQKWEVTANQTYYYSSWSLAALHILVSIPEYQTLEAISKRLELPTSVVSEQLSKLEQMGLIERKLGQWTHSGTEIHLSRTSPLIGFHHSNWRTQAILKAQQSPNSLTNIHFSGVYAISKADLEKMKEIFLKAIESANKLAGPSASEELVALTCDFFVV